MSVTFETSMKKLTPKQHQAVPLLAAGKTGKYVASTIKVNPATVSHWINHEEQFKDALLAYTEAGLYLAQVQYQSLAQEAISELRGLMKNAKSEQVRLKAIELILSPVVLNGGVINGIKKANKMGDLNMTDAGQYDFNMLVEAVTGG